MNNQERTQWIDNDEGLYQWWRSSRMSKADFIREYRTEIDQAITSVTTGRKPAHFLAYDHGIGCRCAYCRGSQ